MAVTATAERDLDTELTTVAGSLNLLQAQLVDLAAEVIATGCWKVHAKRTPVSYLAWITGLSPDHAATIIELAEQRDQYPLVMAAFRRGELSLDQTVQACRAPAWADGKLAEFATNCTVTQLRKTMRSNVFTGPPGEPDPVAAEPTTRVSFGINRTGRWTINGNFDIADGRRIEAALTERKDDLFTQGNTDATWADALLDCADRSLGSVASSSRRDQYRTWFHVDVTSGAATTTDGWRIPQALHEQLTCDGVIQPVWESDGVPFSVGRAQHIVPHRTRRIIERRDRGCRVPGCTASRFVEVHHIVHWEHGGATDTPNLLSLCSRHHKMHHQGRLGITGNADIEQGVTFTDSSGRVIRPNGRPTPPGVAPPSPEPPYVPAINGRMDWAWFGGWIHPAELQRRRDANRRSAAA